MDILLPKFLVQTLRKRAKRKFGRRECRRGRVAAQGRGSAGEEERAAFAVPVIIIIARGLERGDGLARERKGGFDVRVDRLVDFVLGDLHKGLPHAESGVVERYTDVGGRPARAHGAEGVLDFFVGVVGYRERGGLCFVDGASVGGGGCCLNRRKEKRSGMASRTSVSPVLSSAANLWRLALSREINAML